jgi:hypothetical protein
MRRALVVLVGVIALSSVAGRTGSAAWGGQGYYGYSYQSWYGGGPAVVYAPQPAIGYAPYAARGYYGSSFDADAARIRALHSPARYYTHPRSLLNGPPVYEPYGYGWGW